MVWLSATSLVCVPTGVEQLSVDAWLMCSLSRQLSVTLGMGVPRSASLDAAVKVALAHPSGPWGIGRKMVEHMHAAVSHWCVDRCMGGWAVQAM
eukprot:CAMPEP_0202874666 /NCGR_PEP_ID=MMETSP1391-20130828/25810_1 /ASSEMBLY_ACC=CAM_ASM_000867 /TAXON_ID=1034604 /ORGANISM="Chlamydomonas leiostraca, Strain SAG 11-49" /LENGTH=93 /DNA_ID=CAMNT_0049556159 /DNA_START=731 /DNA_END=1012 /DNA_ORIENTATION=+